MSLNLLAKQGSPEACGILISNVSADVSVTNFCLLTWLIDEIRQWNCFKNLLQKLGKAREKMLQ